MTSTVFSLATRKPLKTHCYVGHEYTPDNTGIDSKGYRVCLECARANGRNRLRKFRQKQKSTKQEEKP